MRKRKADGRGFGPSKRRLRKGEQLSFGDRRRKDGKPRKPPGRKPHPRAKVRHRERPEHAESHPLHVTLRAIEGLPSFRRQQLHAAVDRAMRLTRRDDFRICEFSVQTNHLHLIVEADDNRALANGMKSFSVRANRLLNAQLKAAGMRPNGRGRIWGDRYHRRDLTSARQVRNALVYCINNYRKHQRKLDGSMRIDPCSSARWFDGWIAVRTADDGPRPTERALTALLDRGWKRHGLIHPGEAPRSPG